MSRFSAAPACAASAALPKADSSSAGLGDEGSAYRNLESRGHHHADGGRDRTDRRLDDGRRRERRAWTPRTFAGQVQRDAVGLDGNDEELTTVGTDERSQNVFADLE
jgi:hypothetical protein